MNAYLDIGHMTDPGIDAIRERREAEAREDLSEWYWWAKKSMRDDTVHTRMCEIAAAIAEGEIDTAISMVEKILNAVIEEMDE